MTDEQRTDEQRTDEERAGQERTTETPQEARQGRRGIPVLVSLVIALIIAVVFWFGLTYYGNYLDPDQPAELPQAADETTPQPSQ